MSKSSPFDDKYWNLAQASAWVEYREKQLVEELAQADRDAYMALGCYPSMWPAGRKRRGLIEELRRALEQGRVLASGYRRTTPEQLEEVPAAEWTDFVIKPPLVFFAGPPRSPPWSAVRILSADMKRLWRSINEVDGRSKYDWGPIKAMFNEVKSLNPEMSQNELITEVQAAFEARLKKGAPSATSFKRKIKTWT